MQLAEAVALVLVLVLAAVVMAARKPGAKNGKDGFAAVRIQDRALRGARHDAYNQPHAFAQGGVGQNYRSWSATPRSIEEASRAAWFESVAAGGAASVEPGAGAPDEIVANHAPGSSINYQDALVDLVADPRMRANQANWYKETAPKSQTAMKVDTIDEAAAMASQRGHGIYTFRFPGPSQHNPLFITDMDATDHAKNTTMFSFGG